MPGLYSYSAAGTLDGTEEVPVKKSGVNKRTTVAGINASLSTATSTGLSTATSSIVSLSTSTSTGLSTAVSTGASLSTALSTTNSTAVSLSTTVTQIPPNSKSAAYTTVLGDAGESIVHPASDNNARTFTIDSNANVAYPIGTVLTFINMINTVTIAITTDTMYLAGAGTTGSRTLAAYGIATAVKVDTTAWVINGTGLT